MAVMFGPGDKVRVVTGSDAGRVGIVLRKYYFPDHAIVPTWSFVGTMSELFYFYRSGLVTKNEQLPEKWYAVELSNQETAEYRESWLARCFEPPTQEWLDWLERSSV